MIDIFFLFTFSAFFLLSYVGYGFFLTNFIFGKNLKLNLGQLGLIGIFLLIFISYLTNLFISHNTFHNTLILFFGLILFVLNFKKVEINDVKIIFALFLFTLSFLFISKNHDDFPYYHLPFTLYLIENKISFGIGNLNYGFRHHSSILFLNSLTYLPFFKINFLNIPNYLIFIFVNFLLIKEILNRLKTKDIVLIISLIFLIIVNVKFTRLGEYGTDIGGQILLFVVFINFLKIILNREKNIDEIYLNIVFLFLILSLKVYFILYFILIPITFYALKINPFNNKIVNYKLITILFLFLIIFLFQNYSNTGCLIYPVSFTCVGDNFSWSLSFNEIKRLDLWLEIWAKAGATPNTQVEDFESYISGLNWISNWLNKYFFTKMSDFILIIIFINFLVYFLFKNEVKFNNSQYKCISRFFLPLILFVSIFWFFKHPSLRYGGYFPISLLITLTFIMIFFSFRKVTVGSEKFFLKKIKFIFIAIVIVFNVKNFKRINEEFKRNDQYQFKNFPFYFVKEKKYESISFEGKEYMYVTDGYCWATPAPCSNTKYDIEIINGYTFFQR